MSMVCWLFDVPLPQTSDSRFEFSGTVLRRDFSAVDRLGLSAVSWYLAITLARSFCGCPATSPTSSGLTMNDRMPFSDASGRRGEEEEWHGILQLQEFDDCIQNQQQRVFKPLINCAPPWLSQKDQKKTTFFSWVKFCEVF